MKEDTPPTLESATWISPLQQCYITFPLRLHYFQFSLSPTFLLSS